MDNIPPAGNRRVLVIDDNPAIHEDFKKILTKRSAPDSALENLEAAFLADNAAVNKRAVFEMDSAFQGQEGAAKHKQAQAEGRPYALAFVDMRMPPGWDGVETIKELWKQDARLQVVICTAYSDHSWDEIIDELGNRQNLVVLKKPFENVEVLQLAEMLSEKWSLTDKPLPEAAGLISKQSRL